MPAQFGQLLENPQILLSPEKLTVLAARIDEVSPGSSEQVIGAAQVALGDAVTNIFLIGTGIVAVGLAIGLFMPRIRMRGREELMAEAAGETPPPEDEEAGGFGVEQCLPRVVLGWRQEAAGAPGE